MRIKLVVLMALVVAPALTLWAGTGGGEADGGLRLTVLHSSDAESRLLNAGPGLEDFGGVARFKAVVEGLRSQAQQGPNSASILLSGGDNYAAGPEFQASLDRGASYLDAIAMMLIGYDASAIGNQEFDFGPDVFANFVCSLLRSGQGQPIAACGGDSGRSAFPFVSANLDFSGEPRLQELVEAGAIEKSTVITKGEHRIGVVGVTTPDLPFLSSPRDVAVITNTAAVVQAEVDALQARGVNKIIVLTHLQAVEEDRRLAGMLRGVDVIVSGGGGELLSNPGDLLVPGDAFDPALRYPLYAVDAAGVEVPIVTTPSGYRYVGRLVVEFDEEGRVTAVDRASGPVRVASAFHGGVEPDGIMVSAVERPLNTYLEELSEHVLATSEVELDGRIAPGVRTQETNLGNLLADALLWQARELAAAFDAPLPDVALQNGGGIHTVGVLPAGPFTRLNTFEVAPFASFVAIVEGVTPDQFKLVMENAVSQAEMATGRFGQVAGFRIVWDSRGEPQHVDEGGHIINPGSRIVSIQLDDGRYIVQDGRVVAGAPDVNFATLDFLARGGDQYSFPDAVSSLGVTYRRALENYVVQGLSGVISAVQYPEGGEGRIVRLP